MKMVESKQQGMSQIAFGGFVSEVVLTGWTSGSLCFIVHRRRPVFPGTVVAVAVTKAITSLLLRVYFVEGAMQYACIQGGRAPLASI
jgi:hypothetical protein